MVTYRWDEKTYASLLLEFRVQDSGHWRSAGDWQCCGGCSTYKHREQLEQK